MSLYARSDLCLVAVPAESGGCGQSHIRPVVAGAPAKLWKLDCPSCTKALAKDDQWSSSSLEIPLTPDESRVAKRLEEEGDRVMHQVSAALAKSSIESLRTAQAGELEAHKAAQERAELEDRYMRAVAELERLSRVVGKLEDLPADGPENLGEASAKQVTIGSKGTAVASSQGISGRQGACPQCGGPMRRPGAKGPTPKGICLDCRKVRAA